METSLSKNRHYENYMNKDYEDVANMKIITAWDKEDI